MTESNTAARRKPLGRAVGLSVQNARKRLRGRAIQDANTAENAEINSVLAAFPQSFSR